MPTVDTSSSNSWKIYAQLHSPTFRKHKQSIFETESLEEDSPEVPIAKILDEVCSNAKTTATDLTSCIKKLEAEKTKYLKEAEKLNSKAEKLNSSYSQLKHEQSELSAAMGFIQKQCIQMEAELNTFQGIQEKHNQLEGEHKVLQETCKTLEKRIGHIEKKKNKLNVELTTSKVNLVKLEHQIKLIEEELVLERKKVQALQGNVDQMKQQQLEAQAKLAKLNNDVDSLTGTLNVEKGKVAQLEIKAANLDHKVGELETKVNTLENTVDIKCAALQQSVDAFEALNSEAQQLRKDLESNELEALKTHSMPRLDEKVWNHLIVQPYQDNSVNIIFRISSLITGLFQYMVFKYYNRSEIERQIEEASNKCLTPLDFQNSLSQIEQPLFA